MVVAAIATIFVLQPVTADETLPHGCARFRGNLGAYHCRHRRVESRARGKACLVEGQKPLIGTDDTIPVEIIAQRKRDYALHGRIGSQKAQTGLGDVAGWLIDMEDTRKDQLQRRTLRSDNQIDTFRIALEPVLCLSSELKQQHQHGHGNSEQQDIECCGQGTVTQICPRKLQHGSNSPSRNSIVLANRWRKRSS